MVSTGPAKKRRVTLSPRHPAPAQYPLEDKAREELTRTAESLWGIFEFSSTTGKFTNKVPIVITSTDDLDTGIPKASIGAVGAYAIVATNKSNPAYYKNRSNAWVLLG